MNKDQIVKNIVEIVKEKLSGEGSGHDWWHIYRVWNTAKELGAQEEADMFVVELAALLHDIADWKFHGGDDTVGPKVAREIMEKQQVPEDVIEHVCSIILTMSFKGAHDTTPMKTLEGKIVQDADRLDALGAVGIGRTFAYGGHVGSPMHNPEKKAEQHTTKEAYFAGGRTTINHFYEKLLLLKDRMNTSTAKKVAQERHEYMQGFLDRFYKEWEGQH